jgi:MoxR-like ATPase
MRNDTGKALDIIRRINQIILGKEQQVKEVMLTILAGGHVLLEDIPGVGKTTLAHAYADACGLAYKRLSCTPDVMPSDLTGFSIYSREAEKFVYQQGIVFCNLLLADELNRASPKTQSALLEVMEEGRVSVEGITRHVPEPFLVIATQNPAGSAGTQRLPDSQVDRFMVSLTLGYPEFMQELQMAMQIGQATADHAEDAIISRDELLAMQEAVKDVFVKESIYRYLLELVRATRHHSGIAHGASPRATIALVKLSKAAAWLDGRDFVTPADVLEQFPFVIRHRLILNAAARMEHGSKTQIIEDILKSVKKPPMGEEEKSRRAR